VIIKTVDDFREELLPCFRTKAKGKDALLGKYLESKQPKQVKGELRVDRIDLLELIKLHKVPDDPKCIRSIMPLTKNKYKRTQSAGAFGRSFERQFRLNRNPDAPQV
jgi:hypothetical protein